MSDWPTIGEECGIPPEEPRRPVQWRSKAVRLLDDETKAEIIKLYQDNELPMNRIAQQLNETRTLPMTLRWIDVSRILESANITIRRRGVTGGRLGAETTRRAPIPGIDEEYRAGASLTGLRNKYHSSIPTIKKMLIDMGVTIREHENEGNESG